MHTLQPQSKSFSNTPQRKVLVTVQNPIQAKGFMRQIDSLYQFVWIKLLLFTPLINEIMTKPEEA
jgi:hypothetical protein